MRIQILFICLIFLCFSTKYTNAQIYKPKKLFLNEINEFIRKDFEQNYFCYENIYSYYLISFEAKLIYTDSTYFIKVLKSCNLLKDYEENLMSDLIYDFHSKKSFKLDLIENDIIQIRCEEFRNRVIDLLQSIELKDGEKYPNSTFVLPILMDTRTIGLKCKFFYKISPEFEMLSELGTNYFVLLTPLNLGPKTAENED